MQASNGRLGDFFVSGSDTPSAHIHEYLRILADNNMTKELETGVASEAAGKFQTFQDLQKSTDMLDSDQYDELVDDVLSTEMWTKDEWKEEAHVLNRQCKLLAQQISSINNDYKNLLKLSVKMRNQWVTCIDMLHMLNADISEKDKLYTQLKTENERLKKERHVPELPPRPVPRPPMTSMILL